MNLFRKKIIALTTIAALIIVAGGFCYISAASAKVVSGNLTMEHDMSDHGKNMANHADTDSNGIDSCCANETSEVASNSDKSTRNLIKFSISAVSQADAFSQALEFAGDKFYIYSNSPPMDDGLLASVIKKE